MCVCAFMPQKCMIGYGMLLSKMLLFFKHICMYTHMAVVSCATELLLFGSNIGRLYVWAPKNCVSPKHHPNALHGEPAEHKEVKVQDDFRNIRPYLAVSVAADSLILHLFISKS